MGSINYNIKKYGTREYFSIGNISNKRISFLDKKSSNKMEVGGKVM